MRNRPTQGGVLLAFALALERFLLRRFDLVITISDRMQDALREGGVKPERLRVVRNWVDLGNVSSKAGQNVVRQALGLADSVQVVLYAGNIGRKQALDQMLDAAGLAMNWPRCNGSN